MEAKPSSSAGAAPPSCVTLGESLHLYFFFLICKLNRQLVLKLECSSESSGRLVSWALAQKF